MIIDKVENIRLYSSLLNNLENGLQAVEMLKNPEVGRYEFEGGFFMVQKGITNPMEDGDFEVHRKYVDVQIMLEGSEELAWSDIEDLTAAGEYNLETDKKSMKGNFNHVIKISEGMFYIVFPHDGHRAACHTTKKQRFTKVVMKLPVI